MMTSIFGAQRVLQVILGMCHAPGASEHAQTIGGASHGLVRGVGNGMTGTASAAMIMVNGLWLAWVIHTQAVAEWGLPFFSGMVIMLPGLERLGSHAVSNVAFVFALAAPLFLGRGGRFIPLRRGWNVAL
ncbi:hypothetical protein [Sagittula salina]|uniref:Uncharacterized protein n=1 Tax=Sagittula salina TaxID=2820268 RepID=A0A940MTY9_9RHOB|nr:hypothetical protein [Sagittula salina]MBP0482909.1 hypothetical protein [Sagittula salina]